MDALEKAFRGHPDLDSRFDPMARHVYSVDASIYEVEPLGIVLPKTREALIEAVQIAHAHQVPVIARGAATGITGGCLGHGLIIDTSKYLNRILSIDTKTQTAVCEPGVIQDHLNKAAAVRQLRLGPDTSTGNRATLGGMAANNAAGARSLRFGKMVDHVKEIELVLAHGDVLQFHACDAATWKNKCQLPTLEGNIYRKMEQIRQTCKGEILHHFAKIPRRVSGYNLDTLIEDFPLNLSRLIVGSEGTLGVISKMTVSLVPKLQHTGLCLLFFHQMSQSLEQIPLMLQFHPLSVELIDHHILEMGRLSPLLHSRLGWLKGRPEALLAVEFDGHSEEEVKDKLHHFQEEMQRRKIGDFSSLLLHPQEIEDVWAVRKAGLELLLSKRSYSRAIAFIEDLSIPPEHLASFMPPFFRILEKFGKQAGIYGHAGAGCLHIRPYIDLRDPKELETMQSLMEAVADLVLEEGGALSGEHGDGRVRSWLNPKMFGPRLMQAFQEVKEAFDPSHLMNPHKIVNGLPFLQDLRLSPTTPTTEEETFLNFSAEGGFSLAADLCNGNGLCRKQTGLMCPSFQATQDEYDTTRARAQSLRAFIHKKLSPKETSLQEVEQVLDLCLECKGCKTECPSHVDMAKMKAEWLFKVQEIFGYSFRNQIFAHFGKINAWLFPFRKGISFLQRHCIPSFLLEWMGISSKRPLPSLAPERFSKQMEHETPKGSGPEVVLFVDTFTEFHCPEVGRTAYHLLTQLGFSVIIPPWICCGRTYFSKGLLRQARTQATLIVKQLLPYAKRNLPIVVLEPSCLSMLKEDLAAVLPAEDSQNLAALFSNCFLVSEFLELLRRKNPSLFAPFKIPCPVIFHGHCHQKAAQAADYAITFLKALSTETVDVVPSGCCGMAGSFGYEKEHYALSMKIGNLVLFPYIQKTSEKAVIVAEGFSCRHQILHGTGRQALHIVELFSTLYSFDQVENK